MTALVVLLATLLALLAFRVATATLLGLIATVADGLHAAACARDLQTWIEANKAGTRAAFELDAARRAS